mgnify:CR=1 FL=1
MEIYKDSFVSEDEFDFGSILPYFRNPVVHTRSKYETLMDPLSDKIKYLPESKRLKYTKFMMNIIAHLSVLSRIVEREIKYLNIPENDLESDIEISYV